MSGPRTARQRADDFDLALFRLIDRAEAEAQSDKRWVEVARRLSTVRSVSFHLMHPDDRRLAREAE